MAKRSWRCIGLTLLLLCPAFLLRKECQRQRKTQGFISWSQNSKSGKERDHLQKDVWGNKQADDYKFIARKWHNDKENTNQEYHHQQIGMPVKQRRFLDQDDTYAKNRMLQTLQEAIYHPIPQPTRSSLFTNPSVAALLESWGVNSALQPAGPPQFLDPTISELLASWGGGSPIPTPSPMYPMLALTEGEQFEQGHISSYQLSYSSVNGILQSWYEQANESLPQGAIDGIARKKGMNKVVKDKMSKGRTDAPVSIFPSPSESTYFPTSTDIGKGSKGMGNMMKVQTDFPITISPSPSVLTILPSSINCGKGMQGMSKESKKLTHTPSTSTSVPTTTVAPSRHLKGKMSKSKCPTLTPVAMSPSTVQTANPTGVPSSPTSSSPVKGGKGMSSKMGTGSPPKSKGKGMNQVTKTPTTQTSLSPAPIILPQSRPSISPAATPIPPSPILPPLSTPNTPATVPSLPTPPNLSPNAPFPMNVPVAAPIIIPVTPAAPTQASPLSTPVATPSSIPVSTPIPSPTTPTIRAPNMAPLSTPVNSPTSIPVSTTPITSPTAMVPTVTPPTNAPLLIPVAPPAPVAGNPVAASPYQVVYTPTSGPISAADFASAIGVTCAHVEQAIMDVVAMSPFTVVNDISCQSVMTATTPATISFETNVVFDASSTIMLTPGDIDRIISTAFQSPQVSTLIAGLNMLPSNNPFSASTTVTYSLP